MIHAGVLLMLLFLLAAGTGVGHHFFYKALDRQVVSQQAWIIRAGTAIAYVAKILFAASIGSALTQQLWRSFRSKFLTLGAIDHVFDLKNDPARLFNLEMLAHIKLAVLLAASIWALPFLPIIAPGSVSVKATLKFLAVVEVPTQTLNFSRSHETTLIGSPPFTVNFVEINGVGAAYDGYVGPSSRARGLVYSTVYGGQLLSSDSPYGANCNFTQTFYGPAYQCRELDYTQNNEPGNPFCQNTSNPSANGVCDDFAAITENAFDVTWYNARNSSGDTCTNCTGEAWMDGKLWIEYQYLLPEYRTQIGEPPANATPVPASAFGKHQLVCQSYNASYVLQGTYTNSQETIQGTQTFLDPLNYSAEAFGMDGSAITPSYSGYAIHQLLYSILSGMITLNGREQPIDTSGLGGTRLVEPQPFPQPNSTNVPFPSNPGSNGIQKPIRYLKTAIEELHFNVTVGMLTIPNLIYLQNTTSTASTSNIENIWEYNWIPLAAAYGGCAAVNIFAIMIGIAAIVNSDGVGINRSGVLRILMTTRNRTLDTIIGDRGRGDDDMQEEVEDTRVRFGSLTRRGSQEGLLAFGVEQEIAEWK